MRLALGAVVLAMAGCGAAPQPTILTQARGLIDSPVYARESLMWAEALGLERFTGACDGKLAEALESVEREDGGCDLLLPISPADAVLVSRAQWEALPELLSLYDVEGLAAYRLWSNRPEAVGVERLENGRIRLKADLGPLDMILLREPISAGWEATADVTVSADPIGYTLIDPGQAGALEVELRRADGRRLDPAPLPEHETPIVAPGGVAAAPDYAPPPFEPGAYLTIFGERFRPDNVHVLLDDQRIEPLFASGTQINLRLPAEIDGGPHVLRIVAGGHAGQPEAIEIAREVGP